MYKVSVFCVGKLKERHWRSAEEEYVRRLKPFAKLDMVEVAAEPLGSTVSAEQAMRAEAARIIARLPQDSLVVALDRVGTAMSSERFAEFLRQEGGAGRRIVFVIGGAAGMAPELLARAEKKISLSEMTFTHEMARVFLLEQLYRASMIAAGRSYHY